MVNAMQKPSRTLVTLVAFLLLMILGGYYLLTGECISLEIGWSFAEMSPQRWSDLGVGFCLGLSFAVVARDVFTTGSIMVGACVKALADRKKALADRTKALVSVICYNLVTIFESIKTIVIGLISTLAHSGLAAILERLPPYPRLLVSEVCHKWFGISRKAWLDVKRLDLSPIPNEHIGAIVRQCPNLVTVCASHKSFDAKRLHLLPEASSLSFVSLYDCKIAFCANPGPLEGCYSQRVDFVQPLFSDNHSLPALRAAPWQELVMDRIGFVDDAASAAIAAERYCDLRLLPSSLKRLQLSDLCGAPYLTGLQQMLRLECLILHGINNADVGEGLPEIAQLSRLKELCIGPVTNELCLITQGLRLLASGLLQLEVLFLSDIGPNCVAQLSDFVTKSSLRILVLAGAFDAEEPIALPARKQFPNGRGGPKLPVLNIFVGKEASEKIRFERSDAAIVFPITEPMPKFLDRKEIAEIFEEVWIAAQIKETVRSGGKLWDHVTHDCAVNIQYQ